MQMDDSTNEHRLIESAQFFGTAIFGSHREPMGSIAEILIDCRSGKALYVIATFEHMEIGNDFYPIPWMALKYNLKISVYQTHLIRRQLLGAPKFSTSENWKARSAEVEKLVYDYYGLCY